MRLFQTIDDLGGVAARRELKAADHIVEWLDIFTSGGSLIRVRKGWYANTWAPPSALAAWSAGGRLGCVSAARWHGVDVSDFADLSDGALHVNISRGANLIRSHDSRDVVLHWVDDISFQNLVGDERVAVDRREAARQMNRCPWLSHRAQSGSNVHRRNR